MKFWIKPLNRYSRFIRLDSLDRQILLLNKRKTYVKFEENQSEYVTYILPTHILLGPIIHVNKV